MTDHRMATCDFFDHAFRDVPLMAILRGLDPDGTVRACQRVWDQGVELVEVPLPPDGDTRALEAAVDEGHRRGRPVGAGTILDAHDVTTAVKTGAAFLVAPGVDEPVIAAATEHQVPYLPGVASASEITRARRHGFTWMKAFPAASLGVTWVRSQLQPFPDARFVATGGLNDQNSTQFLQAGCRALGIGTSLASPRQAETLIEQAQRATRRTHEDH